MSDFYGTVQGNRGEGTARGSKESGITAAAQSYEGSVVVYLYEDDDEELRVEVGCPDGSSNELPYYTWKGSYEDFKYLLGL